MNEKRNNDRVIFDTIINLQDNRVVWTKDISISGLSFYSFEKIVQGSVINMKFSVENNISLELFGEVVWCVLYSDPIYISGVRFLNITDKNQFKLDDNIINNLKLKNAKVDQTLLTLNAEKFMIHENRPSRAWQSDVDTLYVKNDLL